MNNVLLLLMVVAAMSLANAFGTRDKGTCYSKVKMCDDQSKYLLISLIFRILCKEQSYL